MNCENCDNWKMKHWGGNDSVKGCLLWNNFLHFGKKPYGETRDFENAFLDNGPKECFEGWACSGGGMAYNNSILTNKDHTCTYFVENH